VEQAPEPGQAFFGCAALARSDFYAQAQADVGDKVAVVVVRGASGLLGIIAQLCALLLASVEGFDGIIDV
jgi:hypothetical protein